MDASVRRATVLITSTLLNGNLPYAVSPDNMTASDPSRTAIAMSLTYSWVWSGVCVCVCVYSCVCVLLCLCIVVCVCIVVY